MDMRKVRFRKKNNGGFTLLELIISVAIMSLIIIIAGQFVVTSANSYSSLQRSVSLSQASKQVMEQMSENSLDSSAAVVYPSKDVIYFVEYTGKVNYGTSGGSSDQYNTDVDSNTYANIQVHNKYNIHAYKYDDTDHTLYYGELNDQTLIPTLDTDVQNIKYEKLCDQFDSDGFNITLETSVADSDRSGKNEEINLATKLHITMNLKKRDKKFNSQNDTTFRGRTVYTPDFSTLANTPYLEEVNER